MSVEFISWYSINYANNRWVYVSWQQIRPNLPGPNLPPKISGAQFARKNVSKAATTIFWGPICLEPFTRSNFVLLFHQLAFNCKPCLNFKQLFATPNHPRGFCGLYKMSKVVLFMSNEYDITDVFNGVLSDVSSNCLPGMRRSHTYCICMSFSPLCVFKCLLNLLASEDA